MFRRVQLEIGATVEGGGIVLFPNKDGKPLTVGTLGNIVREALTAIGAQAEDMSPRLFTQHRLPSTTALGPGGRRGHYRLGLTTNRTVERMLATIDR